MKKRNKADVKARKHVLFRNDIWWRIRRLFKLKERIPGNEKLSVILLSYRRMDNIRHIVESLLVCKFVHEILLSNNNPEVRMEDFIRVKDPRLKIINQSKHCLSSKRYELARELKNRYFMAIDDDIFLTPRQIRKLFMALIENPAVPHGIAGENFTVKDSKIVSKTDVRGKSGVVNVIIWAYAFTGEHIAKYFTILDRLNITDFISEDVIISFSGNGMALCEKLGCILCCPSAVDKNIAVHKQEGFLEERFHLYLQCFNAAKTGII